MCGIAGQIGRDPRVIQGQMCIRDRAAADHPHFAAAVKRVERALYYDYELGDDFYPQFQQNIEILQPLLEKLLA